MAHDYLVHYGIKGMKWGVRKSRPSSGRSRRRSSPEEIRARRDALFTQNIKGGKDKPNVSPAERMVSESRKSVESTSNIFKALSDMKRRRSSFNLDVKKMSNSELQSRINRLNLEKQYKKLTYEDTRSGMESVSEILDMFGDALVVAGGVITVASTINKLKK